MNVIPRNVPRQTGACTRECARQKPRREGGRAEGGGLERSRQRWTDRMYVVCTIPMQCTNQTIGINFFQTHPWFLKLPCLSFLLGLSVTPSDQTFIKCLQTFIKCIKTFIKCMTHLSTNFFVLIFRLFTNYNLVCMQCAMFCVPCYAVCREPCAHCENCSCTSPNSTFPSTPSPFLESHQEHHDYGDDGHSFMNGAIEET